MTVSDKGYSFSITFSLSSLLDMKIPPNFEINPWKLQHGFRFQNTSAFKNLFFFIQSKGNAFHPPVLFK